MQIKKFFIKIFSFLFVAFLGLGGFLMADFQEFQRQLGSMGLVSEDFMKKPAISRYELSRLLNAVECKDCVNPDKSMIDSYSQQFWNQFVKLPGKDFSDIFYRQAVYNQQSYFYCVAYVGDNQYMRGYPLATSPLCAGQFCGVLNTTKAEFLQVVFNILVEYVASQYRTNWKTVQDRVGSLGMTGYAFRNLDLTDFSTISSGLAQCGNNECLLRNGQELKTYAKYCMFNLQKCGFQEFGSIKQGFWPVAELNILYNQNVVPLEEALKTDIGKPVSSQEAVQTFYRLYQKVQCQFNNDYDCDGIDNPNDNCPAFYNPRQLDTDKDGYGDVCDGVGTGGFIGGDGDIDGDGVENPLGIVDANGNIIVGLLTGGTDNCIFVANPDQLDADGNGIGDACEQKKIVYGMHIVLEKIEGSAPVSVRMRVENSDNHTVERDFGDGSQGVGKVVNHIFEKPGLFIIKAQGTGVYQPDIAQATLVVGQSKKQAYALQALATPLVAQIPFRANLTYKTMGEFSQIQWNLPSGIKTAPINTSLTEQIISQDSQTLVAQGLVAGEIKAVSQIVVAGGSYGQGASLSVDALEGDLLKKFSFKTTVAGFSLDDVNSVQWDFGDGQILTNRSLSMIKQYSVYGSKIVTQKISLTDGRILETKLTVYIGKKNEDVSSSIHLTAEKLVVPYGENISLKLSLTSVPLNSISTIVWNFGDGQTKVRNSAVSSQLSESHFYNGPGIFHPTVSVYGPACLFYSQQLTVEVKKPFDCYEAYLNGSLKNFKCDMDKDGMPDICDEDIDGDGRNNILGLILFENQDCSINFGGDTRSQTNAENKFNVDFYALRDYYSHGSCLMDNCPLKTNPNQIDSNLNGVGDVCDDGFFSITGGFGSGDGQGSSNSGGNVNNTDFCLDGNNCFQDADGDGILDSDDACPTVPENYNGVEDLDGCPEIGLQDACGVSQASCPAGQTCISVVNCNQCPCQYADFVGSLIPGDTVRAGLRDFPGQVWYRYSPIRQVPLNP